MTEVNGVVTDAPSSGQINYLYFASSSDLAAASNDVVGNCQVIVVGHEDAEPQIKPRQYERGTAIRTMRTGAIIGNIIGGGYRHEVTGAYYGEGLAEHVDGCIDEYFQVNTAGYMIKDHIASQAPGGTLYTFRRYKVDADTLQTVLGYFRLAAPAREYFNSILIQKPKLVSPDKIRPNLLGKFEELELPPPVVTDIKRIFVPLLATVVFVNGFGASDSFLTHKTNSARLTVPEDPESVQVAEFKRQAATGRVVVPDGA